MSDVTSETVTDITRILDEVDHALGRLRAGTYATCEVCQTQIGDEKLAADPLRSTCEAHPKLAD